MIPFECSFASHIKSKLWIGNMNKKTPADYKLKSNYKAWFKCDNCPHNYKKSIANMTKGIGCPYCRNYKRCDDVKCSVCFEKSFASHEKSIHWHPTKNGDKKPRDYSISCGKKVWFKCDKCPHEFEQTIAHVTCKERPTWCPECWKRKRENIHYTPETFEKSFASHEKSIHWHPIKNGDKKPRDFFKRSDKICWFKCDNCPHDFPKTLSEITRIDGKSSWCPYCSIPTKKICNENNCKHCFERSFASHELCKFWDYIKNKNTIPRNVIKSSCSEYYFICKEMHSYKSAPATIVNMNSGCPICKHKTEKKFHNFAKEFFPNIGSQVRPEGTTLPMDIYTPENQTYHEIDGGQHFKDSKFYKNRTAEENRNHDVTKMIIALRDEGRSVIRIYQPWVWEDKDDWQKRWHNAVSMIDQDKPAVYFIGPEGIYDKHKEDIRWKLGNRFEMKSIA